VSTTRVPEIQETNIPVFRNGVIKAEFGFNFSINDTFANILKLYYPV
jgi:hypothetical protein